MTSNAQYVMRVTVALLLMVTSGAVSLLSAEDADKKSKPLRVEDLPKPIPQAMDQLKRIGNDVGNEISKATSKTAEAVKKAMKENKDK